MIGDRGAGGEEGGFGSAFVGDEGVVEIEEEGVEVHGGHGHIGGGSEVVREALAPRGRIA